MALYIDEGGSATPYQGFGGAILGRPAKCYLPSSAIVQYMAGPDDRVSERIPEVSPQGHRAA